MTALADRLTDTVSEIEETMSKIRDEFIEGEDNFHLEKAIEKLNVARDNLNLVIADEAADGN
jgi:hypothetical protein